MHQASQIDDRHHCELPTRAAPRDATRSAGPVSVKPRSRAERAHDGTRPRGRSARASPSSGSRRDHGDPIRRPPPGATTRPAAARPRPPPGRLIAAGGSRAARSEHRVPDRRRNRRTPTRRQHFRDEERVAGGLVEEIGSRPLRTARRAQSPHPRTADPTAARPIEAFGAGHPTPRAPDGRGQLVAIRHQDQCGDGLDPPSHQTQDIQGRLVRPVNILDDHDRRGSRPQRIHERVGDLVWPATTLHSRNHLAGQHRRDVDERTQRARREQRVARTRHDPDRTRVRTAEAANERGLPDSGLATEQDETSAPAPQYRLEVLLQASSWLVRSSNMPVTRCRHRPTTAHTPSATPPAHQDSHSAHPTRHQIVPTG